MINYEIRDYATKRGHVIAMAYYYIRLFELVCISIYIYLIYIYIFDESTESNITHFLHSLFD